MSTLEFNSKLPWTGIDEEQRRFERILYWLLIPMLILAVAIPLLPLLKLAIEETPPPVPVKLLVQPPHPVVQQASAPAPKPKPAPAESKPHEKPSPAPKPMPSPEAARDVAARRLAAATKELSSLRDNEVITSVDSQRQLSGPVAASNSTSANLTALQASRNSGGISTSGIGTKGTGTTLADYAPTTGGTGGGSTGTGSAGGGGSGRQGVYHPERSKESIQLVFDRNKATFQAIYQRELRQNANLQGKVVLHLTILPSGKVSDCHVISSELHDTALEDKIAALVMQLDFGAEDVPTSSGPYTMSFYPT